MHGVDDSRACSAFGRENLDGAHVAFLLCVAAKVTQYVEGTQKRRDAARVAPAARAAAPPTTVASNLV